jgi:murein DD-endopeptidase MepM/ murein hydrolase activator NlpD
VDIAIPTAEKSYGSPIVAPEAGTVSYVGQMGSGIYDAGTVVQIENTLRGRTVHRLCHLIPGSPTVTAGQKIRQGQIVGKMGHSGYVKPAGKAGTHLHWVLEINGRRDDGRKYVSKPKETNDMLTRNGLDVLVRFYNGRAASAKEVKDYVGKVTFDEMTTKVKGWNSHKSAVAKAKAGTLKPINHSPVALRKAYKEPASKYVAVTEKLYRLKAGG